MTVVKYLTDPHYGCATSGELIAFSRENPGALAQLKEYAKEEMRNKNIPIDEPPVQK